jgi:hypothetical protein
MTDSRMMRKGAEGNIWTQEGGNNKRLEIFRSPTCPISTKDYNVLYV